MYICVPLWVCVYHLHAGASRGQRASDFLELGFQEVVKPLEVSSGT